MPLSTLFLHLREFLTVHEKHYLTSILQNYPLSMELFPGEFTEELSQQSPQQLWQISQQDFSPITNSHLKDYFMTASELCQLPRTVWSQAALTPIDLTKVSMKKQHEIALILPVLTDLHRTFAFTRVLDIGGGMGHLARILSTETKIPIWVIDSNSHVQKTGSMIANRNTSAARSSNLQFLNLKLTEDDPILYEKLKEIATDDTLSIGLHTCGALAMQQIIWSIRLKCRCIFNVGCCYSRLDPLHETNISQIAKEQPLAFNEAALLLATRPHQKSSFDRFAFDLRVNSYRFALAFLFTDLLHQPAPASVGYVKTRVYHGDFADYAKNRLLSMGVSDGFTTADLNSFFHSKSVQQRLNYIIATISLRWQLSRPLELYIILDRALFLTQHGYTVTLTELFDIETSPRNIALIAERQ